MRRKGLSSSAAPVVRPLVPLSASQPCDPLSAGPGANPPFDDPISQLAVRRPVFPVRERRSFSRSARAVRLLGPPVPRNTPTLIVRRVWANIGALDAGLPRRRLSRGRLARLSPLADSTNVPALARSRVGDDRRFSGLLPGFPRGVPPNPVTVSGGVRNLYRRNVRRRKG